MALPAEANEARDEWFTEMKRRSSELYVEIQPGDSLLTLMAIAPDEQAAIRLEQTLRGYLDAGPNMHLLPPWHPDFPLAPEHERARQMFVKLSEPADFDDDPKLNQISQQFDEALRRGDEERVLQLEQELESLRKQLREAFLDNLAQQTDDPAEAEVLKLYRQRPVLDPETLEEGAADPAEADEADPDRAALASHQDFEEELADWNRRMGALLGQLPLEGDKVDATEGRFSATGFVIRSDCLIRVGLTFDRLVDGSPALVKWFDDRQCAGLKYQFDGGY
jgi:hypothetical protein